VAALVVALAVPAIAETKIGGSYRVRGVYWDQGLNNGKFDLGEGSTLPGVGRYFDNRLRLNIDSNVTDALALHVEADSGLGYNGRNGDFQNPAATPDSYDGIWNKGGSFVNLPDAGVADRDVNGLDAGHDIVFQQAYMDFATSMGAFSLGRQWSFWGMGLLVGENRNRLAWSYKMPALQIGAGYDKFFEGDSVAGAFDRSDDQDNYFFWALYEGPNFQLGPYLEYTHADKGDLNGSVLDTAGADLDLDGLNTFGLSLFGNATFGPLALTGEFCYRGGSADIVGGIENTDFNAWAAVVRGTYELAMCTVGGEAGYLTGQDPDETDEIQSFLTPYSFSPFAILGELAINGMDLLGNASFAPASLGGTGNGSYSDFCSNMIYGKAFLQASPMPKLDAYLGIGYAVAQQDRVITATDKRNELGTEIDLSLTYAITPNLTYNFTGGYLFLGDFYNDSPGMGTEDPEDAMLAVHSITINW
jgi:hypothetical protein